MRGKEDASNLPLLRLYQEQLFRSRATPPSPNSERPSRNFPTHPSTPPRRGSPAALTPWGRLPRAKGSPPAPNPREGKRERARFSGEGSQAGAARARPTLASKFKQGRAEFAWKRGRSEGWGGGSRGVPVAPTRGEKEAAGWGWWVVRGKAEHLLLARLSVGGHAGALALGVHGSGGKPPPRHLPLEELEEEEEAVWGSGPPPAAALEPHRAAVERPPS